MGMALSGFTRVVTNTPADAATNITFGLLNVAVPITNHSEYIPIETVQCRREPIDFRRLK